MLLAWKGGFGRDHGGSSDALVAATAAWAPVLAVVFLAQVGVLGCTRRLARGTPRAIVAADMMVLIGRWALLVNHAVAVLIFGWLGTIQSVTGDLVVIDEIIAISPTVAGLMGLWWVYYPIERRARDAVLLRRLDEGHPVFPTPDRWSYVIGQVRVHLLFLLVPILLIVATAELIDWIARRFDAPAWVTEGGSLLAALAVMGGLAPLIARVVLDVRPMPPGPMRDDLMALCRANDVKIRRLLVWRTQGSMINAAVMGIFGPMRYVLVTDALLEWMNRAQLHAVMAHEIGHIRRHHMPWLMATVLALILGTATVLEAPLRLWAGDDPGRIDVAGRLLGLPATALMLCVILLVFGWISRRFERQADTYAATHLSIAAPDDDGADGEVRITADAAAIVASALGAIARLDRVRLRRPSWRHGSIEWRQRYLRSIVGQPIHALAIDRQVDLIKLFVFGTLAIGVAYMLFAVSGAGV